MLFVLTAEPYHDNSAVLGVFNDLNLATAAFLRAPTMPHGDAELWELSSWEDNGPKRKTLAIFGRHVYSVPDEFKYVPVRKVPPKEGEPRQNRFERVDPLTFDW